MRALPGEFLPRLALEIKRRSPNPSLRTHQDIVNVKRKRVSPPR